jgi:hypothetical protein
VQFTGFYGNLGQMVGEAIEARARSALWQRAAEHFKDTLSGEQRIDDAVEAGTKGNG